ncbi:MAG: AI-2E family transporter, partial [Candidatus Pacebacteria bacterium]|nr:AI-2E family transporter [Candidatus Paceibacterota bacterium]
WVLPPVAFTLDRMQTTPAELQVSFAETVRSAGSAIAQGALGVGAEVLNVIAKILVMLYLLFFLLRDGEKIAARLMRMIPLGDTRELFLFERFSTTVRAVMKGTLIVALAQGAIGGLLFAIAGVKSAALWGAAIALVAIIPAAGPAVVWIPAALILFYMGNTFGAIVIALGGGLVLSTIDNILRPILVGKDTNMPDSLILLSVLGGISTFGIAGVILGPVIAALFLALWHLFEEQYHDDLIARG